MSKYGVFSGLYFPVSRENTDQKKLRIWTLHAVSTQIISKSNPNINCNNCMAVSNAK